MGPNVKWLVDGVLSSGGPATEGAKGILLWSEFSPADFLELAAWCLDQAATSKTPEVGKAYDVVNELAEERREVEDIEAILDPFEEEVADQLLAIAEFAADIVGRGLRSVPYRLGKAARMDAEQILQRPLSKLEEEALERCVERILGKPASAQAEAHGRAAQGAR